MNPPWPRSFSPLFIPCGPTVLNPIKQQAHRVSAYPNRIRPYSPTNIGLPTDLPYLAEDERDPTPVDNSLPRERKISRPTRHLKSKMKKYVRRESSHKGDQTGYSGIEAQQQIYDWEDGAHHAEQQIQSPPYFLPPLTSQHGLPTPPDSLGSTRIHTPSARRSYEVSQGSAWDHHSANLQSYPTPPSTPSIVSDPTGPQLEADDAAEADHETMDEDLYESLHRVNEHMRILRKKRTCSRTQIRRLKEQHSAVEARLRLVTEENAQLHREAAYDRDRIVHFERVVDSLNSMVDQGKDDVVNALREIQCLEDQVVSLKKRPCEFDDEEERSTKRGRLSE